MPRFQRQIAILLCLGSAVGRAQSAPQERVDLFAGYSYTHGDFTGLRSQLGTKNYLNGWDAAVTFKAKRWIGATADIAGYYIKEGCPDDCLAAHAQTYLFGPSVFVPFSRIVPFGHFLIGAAHVGATETIPGLGTFPDKIFKDNTSFAFAAGGGADFRLSRHLALRGQLDLLHFAFVISDNQRRNSAVNNSVRISTGIVFRF